MKKGLLFVVSVMCFTGLFAQTQNVGIGTTAPDASAVLDVTATNKGFLPPRVTTAQRFAIPNPANGLVVYDTDLGCLFYYNSGWTSLCQLSGPTGSAGAQGPTGAQGVQGITGAQGVQGATGIDGVTGAQGAQGPTGAQGITGVDGVTGPQGPAGVAGADGATGLQGPAGVQGPQGVAGPQGAQGLQGVAGVAGAQGAQGAQGPQGVAGAAGANGVQGVTGPQGVAGANGAQGPQGVAGANGAQGAQGIQGLQGPTGPSWPTYQINQTTALTVSNVGFVAIPGLTKTITLTSAAKIFVMTDGGIQTNSASGTGYSVVDVVIYINGGQSPDGGFKRLNAVNNNGLVGTFAFWSMGVYAATTSNVYSLAAGTYTIDVRAQLNGGSSAIVGGDNTTVLQGVMQLFVIQ